MYGNIAAKPEYATAKIAVWWDMSDCPIPEGYDARRVRWSIEGELKKLGYSGPVSITAYDDHKQTPVHVLRGLSSTGVVVAHTVPKCRCARMFSDMLEWRAKNPHPATMMLISDHTKDVFEFDLARLQQRTTYNLFLAYSVRSTIVIYLYTSAVWLWKELLESSSATANETTSCCCSSSTMFSCKTCSSEFQSLKFFRKHLSSRDHAVQEVIYPRHEELLDTVTRSWARNYPAMPEYASSQIAVWWDMTGCPIPEGYDVSRLLPSLEGAFKSLGYSGPVSIKAYGDLNQTPDHLLQQLLSIGVSIAHTIPEVASLRIYGDMLTWRDLNPPPATMMLISDYMANDLSWTLAMSQQRQTYNFLLAYPSRPHKMPILVTSAEWLWDSLFAVSETRRHFLQKCSQRGESTEMFSCELCFCNFKGLENLRKHLSSENHAQEEGSIHESIQSSKLYRERLLLEDDDSDDHPEKDKTTSVKPNTKKEKRYHEEDYKKRKLQERKKRRKQEHKGKGEI